MYTALPLVALLVACAQAQLQCPDCTLLDCPQPPSNCQYGFVGDLCGCCQVCGVGPGLPCGGLYDNLGKCGYGLACQLYNATVSGSAGTCVPQDPGLPDLCRLPPAPGPCEAYMPAFFYNVTSARCEGFVYGGCNGNENRFDRVDQCSETCEGKGNHTISTTPRPERPDICEMNWLERLICIFSRKCNIFDLLQCGSDVLPEDISKLAEQLQKLNAAGK